MLRVLGATALGVAAIGVAGGRAGAAPPPKGLWATVNICDTALHPDELGVRANMPGNHTHERMYMRFHAQFYDSMTKKWFDVKGVRRSGWVYAGSARFRRRQAGYTFWFKPPQPGKTFVLRGVVGFEWRARRRTRHHRHRWVVVRRLRANTKGDHPAPGADPRDYSSGTCEITG